jgi:hypothetical protein
MVLVDRGGLWCRVLAARYGEEQEGGKGLLGGGGLRGFARVRGFRGRVVQGGHLEEGGGRGIYFFFWTNLWLGVIFLMERFGRLFDLVESKSRTKAEMYALGWGGGGEACV